ncbi:acyl-CoA thioesterase [Frankia nepalensis]|uniref:acyl-CoA thioesterase n=1 Tax=Frankia nepalensis TaxID=1836974 RepID=UPI0027DC2BBB|nr:acyl-CoA thioesterase domain-containing protein [Frankia nepalensis]
MPPGQAGVTLLDLLALEELDRDLYRTTAVFDEPYFLYGGQVAAQALLAAGRTVPEGRLPHSLHGYFLSRGNAARSTIFRVERDRDGRSFSARRVVAVQGGQVIFNMSCSFHVPEGGADRQVSGPPPAGDPETLPAFTLPRLFDVQARRPAQPYPDAGWDTRFWARATVELGDDPLLHASVLTYLSDVSGGLAAWHDGRAHTGASLDHAVWFHRPARLDDWVLMDVTPLTAASGRGLYNGTIHTPDGRLAASLIQEALFRDRAANGA